MRAKHCIVLDALEMGKTIEIDGYRHVMAQKEDGSPCVAVLADSSERGEIMLGNCMSLDHFLAACHRMSDDEIAGICMDMALEATRKTR